MRRLQDIRQLKADTPANIGETLAVSQRDALAIADQTNRTSFDIAYLRPTEERSEATEKIKSRLREAVASQDKEILFQTGTTFMNPSMGPDVMKGFALQLVACDLGYGCSVDNPFLLMSNCQAVGRCNDSYTC